MKKFIYIILSVILLIGLTGCNQKSTNVTRINEYDGTKVIFTEEVSGVSATYVWKLRDYDFTEKGIEEIIKLNPKKGDRVKVNTIGILNFQIDHIELVP